AADIDKQWLKDKKKIGITAGASTPEWLMKEVIEVMSEEKKDLQIEEIIEEEGVNNEAEDTVIEEVEAAVEDNEENTADDTEENADETIKTVEETGDNEIKLDEPEDVDTIKNEQIDYSNNEIADLKKGQIVTGTVSQIEADGVYVDVNYKTDGFIPLRELSHKNITDPAEVVELNEEIDVVILTLEDDEGNMILSKKRADYEKAWETIMDAYENNKVIEAEVTKVVKGGLVVDVGLRGFIPASHVAIGYVENLDEYLGKTLRLKAIEVERDKNNVVLSAKEVLEEEKAELKKKTLEKLEEGQVIKGVITKLVDFGAFVDLGGIEGLLHISEMSWGRIDHPTDIFEEGQEIEVKVLGFNKEEERISLGYKQLLPDPWQQFLDKHYVGEIVTGTVTKLVDFGAFVEIEKGVEGLIHISQLSYRHVKTADEVVSVGEEVAVKIININEEQKRVGLSIKELEEKPVPRTGQKAKVHESKAEEEQATGGVTIREMVGDLDLGSEE
ncbi:MAG: 30S ribosomal protein S1, partial [Halanaerobiaceae bacterium]|nr:30S ribosomal protein S1 [Halanaerobiaceae bacterium]